MHATTYYLLIVLIREIVDFSRCRRENKQSLRKEAFVAEELERKHTNFYETGFSELEYYNTGGELTPKLGYAFAQGWSTLLLDCRFLVPSCGGGLNYNHERSPLMWRWVLLKSNRPLLSLHYLHGHMCIIIYSDMCACLIPLLLFFPSV